MSVPASTISICSGVRLSSSYEHTIFFADLNAQSSYFSGKVVKTFPGYTYLRKEWSIKVASTMSEALNWNYLFFRNPTPPGDGKTYYYFINKVEYVNDATVELFLELDVLQTYYFDYTTQYSFTERAHPKTDVPGDNVVEEGLDLGEYTYGKVTSCAELTDLCILIMSNVDPDVPGVTSTGSMFNNVYGGFGLYAVHKSRASYLSPLLNFLAEKGKSDSILAMWMYPRSFIKLYGDADWLSEDRVTQPVFGVKDISSVVMYKPDNVDGYVPLNKKLLTYPFTFIQATNNEGNFATYRYERFKSDDVNFSIRGALSPECGAKMFPMNYNCNDYGGDVNYPESMNLSGYPTCSWSEDVYKLWLAQNFNQMNHQLDTAGIEGGVGFVKMGASALTLSGSGVADGLGQVYNAHNSIQQLVAQKKDMSITPPQAKGQYTSSVAVADNRHTFEFWERYITKDFAERIDNYFSLYGYARNCMLNPNVKDSMWRKYWCYVKTADLQAFGNVPNTHMNQIRAIYNKGITFWKNPDEVGVYFHNGSMENPIV